MHPNFIYFWLTRPLSAFQIACCPPGMQATTLDMVQAYRNSLIILAHKKYLVVSWNDGIYVQHNAIEGLCLASGIQGTPADACIEILCMNGIHPVFKWVNDFIIFHSPSLPPCQMTYLTMTMICCLSSTSPICSAFLGTWLPRKAKTSPQGSST